MVKIMDGPRCVVCGALIEQIPHEHKSFWLKRTTCSDACRNEQRSRTHKSKIKVRVALAVESWGPGTSIGRLAQIHSVSAFDLRAALIAAGLQPPVATNPKPKRTKLPKPRRGPGEDPLLARLLRVYGPRQALPVRRAA
jgi:hypothetical protein